MSIGVGKRGGGVMFLGGGRQSKSDLPFIMGTVLYVVCSVNLIECVCP